jgi:hypothetical protein
MAPLRSLLSSKEPTQEGLKRASSLDGLGPGEVRSPVCVRGLSPRGSKAQMTDFLLEKGRVSGPLSTHDP